MVSPDGRGIGSAAVTGSWGLVYLDLTWLAHRGDIYRLIGATSPRDFETHRVAFASAAASFRPLDPEQRSSILDTRLRFEGAREGESLEALSERTGNTWSIAETAVSNGIESAAALVGGDLVKIAVEEPHAPPEG